MASADTSNKLPNCDPCMFTNEANTAISFCIECTEYLCLNCLTHHRKIKSSRHHKVLHEDEMPAHKKHYEQLQTLTKCPKHPTRNIVYKCENHNTIICAKCVTESHPTCKEVIDITNEKYLEKSVTTLNERLQSIKALDSRNHVETIKRNISTMKTDRDKIVKRRRELISLLVQYTHRLEKALPNIDHEYEKNIEILSKNLDDAEKIEYELSDTEDFIEVVLKHGSAFEQHIFAVTAENLTTCNRLNNQREWMQLTDELNPKIECTLRTLFENTIRVSTKKVTKRDTRVSDTEKSSDSTDENFNHKKQNTKLNSRLNDKATNTETVQIINASTNTYRVKTKTKETSIQPVQTKNNSTNTDQIALTLKEKNNISGIGSVETKNQSTNTDQIASTLKEKKITSGIGYVEQIPNQQARRPVLDNVFPLQMPNDPSWPPPQLPPQYVQGPTLPISNRPVQYEPNGRFSDTRPALPPFVPNFPFFMPQQPPGSYQYDPSLPR